MEHINRKYHIIKGKKNIDWALIAQRTPSAGEMGGIKNMVITIKGTMTAPVAPDAVADLGEYAVFAIRATAQFLYRQPVHPCHFSKGHLLGHPMSSVQTASHDGKVESSTGPERIRNE